MTFMNNKKLPLLLLLTFMNTLSARADVLIPPNAWDSLPERPRTGRTEIDLAEEFEETASQDARAQNARADAHVSSDVTFTQEAEPVSDDENL
jgi:hypothetical protein